MLFIYPPESQKSSLYYVMQALKAQLPNVVVKVNAVSYVYVYIATYMVMLA